LEKKEIMIGRTSKIGGRKGEVKLEGLVWVSGSLKPYKK